MKREADERERPTGLGLEDPQFNRKARRFIVRVLIALYLISVFFLGYWYWMRPVRADQFKAAQENWRGLATVYGIPIPKDERWGW